MNRFDRQIMQLCQDVIVLDSDVDDGAPDLSEMAQQAGRILERLRRPARPSPSSKLKGPTRKQAKAATDAQHDLDWEAIKRAVYERARVESDGGCELGCGRESNDPHHLIGGSGKRRPNERFDTVIGICRVEHDAYEDGDLEVLEKIRAWAERHCYWMALGEVDRRIARIKRIRAATAGGSRNG